VWLSRNLSIAKIEGKRRTEVRRRRLLVKEPIEASIKTRRRALMLEFSLLVTEDAMRNYHTSSINIERFALRRRGNVSNYGGAESIRRRHFKSAGRYTLADSRTIEQNCLYIEVLLYGIRALQSSDSKVQNKIQILKPFILFSKSRVLSQVHFPVLHLKRYNP